MSTKKQHSSATPSRGRKEKEPPYTEFQVEHSVYQTQLNKKFETRKKWAPKDHSKLISYIPGTILKVLVKEGQEVKEGEPLLVLEAMKMKNSVVSEHDGVIRKIHVETGQKVAKGYVMMELTLA